MSLTPEERIELAEQLYASVTDDVEDVDCANAWADEIRARAEQVRAGLVKGIPANEVFARIRAKLADRG